MSESNQNKLRERDVSRILSLDRPLLTARTAIDAMCEDHEATLRSQLRDGAYIEDLIEAPFSDPIIDAADTISKTFHPQDGDTTSRWTDWFHLQTAMQTAPFRIFHKEAFSGRGSRAVREHLHRTAYDIYGNLLGDALYLYGRAQHPIQADELRGVVSELAIAALLTSTDQESSGARLSSAVADILTGVDLRYAQIHSVGEPVETVSVSVKTSRSGQAYEKVRNRVASIVANEVIADPTRGQRYIAQLIACDVKESLPTPLKRRVVLAAQKTTTIINQQVQTW